MTKQKTAVIPSTISVLLTNANGSVENKFARNDKGWEQLIECQTRSKSTHTLFSLHALTGHPVDDAVTARVHVPDAVGNEVNGQSEAYHAPENDVEYDSVVLIHCACQAYVVYGTVAVA